MFRILQRWESFRDDRGGPAGTGAGAAEAHSDETGNLDSCRGLDPWDPDIPDVDSRCAGSRHPRCFRCGGSGPQRMDFPSHSASQPSPHHHLLNKQTVCMFCELVSGRRQTLEEEGQGGSHSLIDSFILISYLTFPIRKSQRSAYLMGDEPTVMTLMKMSCILCCMNWQGINGFI